MLLRRLHYWNYSHCSLLSSCSYVAVDSVNVAVGGLMSDALVLSEFELFEVGFVNVASAYGIVAVAVIVDGVVASM